jgi:hypothetical protein
MGSLTQAEALELLRPFRVDFEYYAPRALKIRSKNGDVIPFCFNAAQKHLHQQIEAQRSRTGKVRVLVLKGRQQGISTYVEARYYWRTSGEFGKKAFILTHLAQATSNLFAMTKRYHDHCPAVLRPQTAGNSSTSLVFDRLDSSFSVATAGSKGAGRSDTAQFFHGSEVAFWDNALDHMAGIGQIVPNAPGTEIILESTGNGTGNLFHSMWEDAERGHSEYIAVFIPWFWQPEYQETPPEGWEASLYDGPEYARAYGLTREQAYWREKKIRDEFRGDVALFDQEYPGEPSLAFRRQAEESYIQPALVKRARMQTGVEARGAKIMALDPAEMGADDAVVLMRQGRVVPHDRYVRYHGKMPMELVGLVAKLADAWKPDFLAVDATGMGGPIADRLRELGYPVVRVIVGERATDDVRFVLVRDELWGLMNDWLMDHPAVLPDCPILQSELTSVPYTYDSSRRLKLKSKEYMRSKGLKSPDGGDAVALTFAVTTAHSFNEKPIDHDRRSNWRAR